MARPFLIQESILTDTAAFFIRAVRNGDAIGGRGVLRFPEDDQTTWEVLLHWLLKDKLEWGYTEDADAKMKGLVECWVLGDKNDIKQFQDEVMWELIRVSDHNRVELNVIRLAFDSTPVGSPIRALLAEELLHSSTTRVARTMGTWTGSMV